VRLQSLPTLAGLGLAVFLAAMPALAAAQPPPAQHPASQTPAPRLSADQLDDLVAPVALYPDPMLGQLLVASTYPLELAEAEQWLKANSSLQGTQLMNAAKQQNWDPSVQAMVAFPQVLDRLTQDIRWTADLGNAFLAQQADVMTAVQTMRARAEANGRLKSNSQETVSTATEGGQSAIEIMPANPQVIYVPVYDPAYIWGPPVWGAYPALWYPPYGWGFWPGFNVGLWFGGWGWGGWGWGGWGWSPGWFNRGVFVNYGFFNHYGFRGVYPGNGRGIWAHNPSHRLGVPYSNGQLNARYGAASMASRANAMRGNAGSYGMRNSGAGAGARMSPGGPAAQGFRGGTQGAPRAAAPAFRGSPSPSVGGTSRSFGWGGSHGYGGGGFHGGGGGFHGGGGGFHGFGGGGFGGGHFGGGGHGGGHR